MVEDFEKNWHSLHAAMKTKYFLILPVNPTSFGKSLVVNKRV